MKGDSILFIHYSRIIVLLILPLFASCASIQMAAVPEPGVTVSPDGSMASASKEGMAISVAKAETPHNLDKRLTTFNVTIINQTDQNYEFIPKEFVLFDQMNRQFLALGPDALVEAAVTGSGTVTHAHWGVGYHYYHPGFFYHGYYSPFWYDPWPVYSYSRPYRALLAKALPIRPISVYPHSTVSGYVYFGISAEYLERVTLKITRFAERPTPENPSPREIPNEFRFNVFKK